MDADKILGLEIVVNYSFVVDNLQKINCSKNSTFIYLVLSDYNGQMYCSKNSTLLYIVCYDCNG